jgi:hypothetical protein
VFQKTIGSAQQLQGHSVVGMEVGQAGQGHFKAREQGTGIHIVLDHGIGDNNIANGNAAIASASHTREQDVGNSILFHKQCCSHRSGNLANTRQDAHSVDSPQLPMGVDPSCVRGSGGPLHGFHGSMLFFLQGTDDPKPHAFPRSSVCLLF